MSHYDELIDANGEGSAFPGVGVCEFIVQGLTQGIIKIQYLIPKTDVMTNPVWVDYPGLAFTGNTYKKVYLSEEGVYFRAVGVDNNNDVYVRFRTLNIGVSVSYTIPEPMDSVQVGFGYTCGVTGPIPTFTGHGDGTIDVSSCNCILKAGPDHNGSLMLYEIDAVVSMPLVDMSVNYLTVSYNNGVPIYDVTTDREEVNFSNVVPVYTIYREGTIFHELEWGALADGLAEQLLERQIKCHRFEREEYDGLLLSEYGTRNVSITEGKVWYGITAATAPAFQSTIVPLNQYVHVAGVWTKTTPTSYSNTQYDNGTNLQTLALNKYTNAWFYTGVDEDDNHVYYIMGNQYANLTEAEAAPTPTDIPDIVRKHAILVGRFIVQQGATTAVKVQSAFSGSFSSSTIVTDGVVIRQKIFTGTTAGTEGGSTTITHNLDSTKIIHMSGTVEPTTGIKYPQEHQGTAGYQFNIMCNTTSLVLKTHATNSENILTKPFKVVVTYTE